MGPQAFNGVLSVRNRQDFSGNQSSIQDIQAFVAKSFLNPETRAILYGTNEDDVIDIAFRRGTTSSEDIGAIADLSFRFYNFELPSNYNLTQKEITFIGGEGNDYFVGTKQDDTAVFSGNISEYSFDYNEETKESTITHKDNGIDGTDIYLYTEIARFKDAQIALPPVDGDFYTKSQDILDAGTEQAGVISITAPANMIDGDIDYTVTLSTSNSDNDVYNFVYIVDTSGSMTEASGIGSRSRMSVTIEAYQELTNALAESGVLLNSKIAIIPFNSDVNTSDGEALVPFNTTSVIQILSGLSAQGGTAFVPALQAAKSFFSGSQANPNAINIIYFLSDGKSTESRSTIIAASQALQEYGEVRAYGVGNDVDIPTLDIIDSGGNSDLFNPVNVDSSAELELSDLFQTAAISTDDISKVTVSLNGEVVEIIQPSQLVDAVTGLGLEFKGSLTGLNTAVNAVNELVAEVSFNDNIRQPVRVDINISSSARSLDVVPTLDINSILDPISKNYTAKNDDEKVIGNNRNNIIKGRNGDNNLKGASGDDILIAGSGNNILDGGTGTDIAQYATTAADLGTVTKRGTTVVISKTPSDTQADATSDTLRSIEYIELQDTWIDTKDLSTSTAIEFDGVLVGANSSVTIQGTENDDIITSRDGNDIVFGAAGNDTLQGDNGNDNLKGEADDDTLLGGDGNDKLFGGDGNDTLEGNAGDDLLRGDDGDDTLKGGAGDDTLQGGNGDDTLKGGDGEDTLKGGAGDDTVIEAQGLGNDIIYGGAGDDTIFDGLGNNKIYGQTGNDNLTSGTGDDYINGGLGNDTIVTTSGNNRLYGQAGRDTITGGSQNDYINGGASHDILSGGLGINRLIGGGGTDVALYNQTYDEMLSIEKAGQRITAIGQQRERDYLLGIEYLDFIDTWVSGETLEKLATANIGGATYGLRISETLIGNNEANQIFAREGDDRIFGENGRDRILGGAGNDYIEGGIDNDTIFGGDGDDIIEGTGEAGYGHDTIYGGAGNDTIEGGAGNDIIEGSLGNDIIDAGSGDDTIKGLGRRSYGDDTIYGGTGNDTIEDYYGNNKIYGGTGNDTIKAGQDNDYIEGGQDKDSIFAGDGDDIIEGAGEAGWGHDRLYGGAGNDSIKAGAGDDYIEAGSGNDYIDAGSGNDTIEGSGEAGFGDDTIYGGAGNDRIEDLSGSNKLYGNDGDDYLESGVGRDYLNGGNGNDTIYAGDSADYIDAGTGNDEVYGGSGNDTIYGKSGDDRVYGGSGNDTVTGGLGDDHIYGGAGDDTLQDYEGSNQIYGGGGNDRITGGHRRDFLRGNEGNDVILGAAYNDTLIGDDGNDRLVGGDGNDLLIGGAGNDTLVGGADQDIFRIQNVAGFDIIEDYSIYGDDALQLDQGMFLGSTVISQSGSSAIVTYGGRKVAELLNTKASKVYWTSTTSAGYFS